MSEYQKKQRDLFFFIKEHAKWKYLQTFHLKICIVGTKCGHNKIPATFKLNDLKSGRLKFSESCLHEKFIVPVSYLHIVCKIIS